MAEILFMDEFGDWWRGLGGSQQDNIATAVGVLADQAPSASSRSWGR